MGAIDQFVTAARAFIAWAEAPASTDPHAEAVDARRNVVGLIAAAIALPDGTPSLSPSISDDEYQRVYMRFGNLPFNYYSECFNPLVVPAEEPVVADLADDLADIWRDLKGGLLLYDSGETESAVWHWSNHYSFHWGHHATAALYALQSWLSSVGDDDGAERAERC
ncbi:MAG: hypothetical protein QOE68_3241 [Thermoanaerobaculia bacterium]|jgi:hypothetical protein|nr:hypothetical protein [Thermoanaerobaculia bacterium]